MEKVLYAFCGQSQCVDGRAPTGNLLEVNGVFYGTTSEGGKSCFTGFGCGTVFSFDPNTGTEKVLYAFCLNHSQCPDGDNPNAGLIEVGGLLYGTTDSGGSGTACNGYGCGTVFSIDPNTGVEKVLHAFVGGRDGQQPRGLIAVNGVLYGTALGGAVTANCTAAVSLAGAGCGAVFSIDLNTGTEKVVYAFCHRSNCKDGLDPSGVVAANGVLYGTTYAGGNMNCGQVLGCGTIFSLDPVTGAEKVLYAFCSQANCTDGLSANGGMIDVNGLLYGTTAFGGSGGSCEDDCGTVFSFDPNTGAHTVVLNFCRCAVGEFPTAGVIAVKGKLYGTTWLGGDHHKGNVFSLDLKTGEATNVYSFCDQLNCTDGDGSASVVDIAGELYGVTGIGGISSRECTSSGCGTVFMLEKEH